MYPRTSAVVTVQKGNLVAEKVKALAEFEVHELTG
jgi:hypothetical protein